jgi:hypothetical protein
VSCNGTSCVPTCPSTHHLCNGNTTCKSNTDKQACGAGCVACPEPANSTAACTNGQCTLTCANGYHLCGDTCKSNSSWESCGTRCSACPAAPSGETSVCIGASVCENRCLQSYSFGLDGSSPSPLSVDTTSFPGNGVSPTVSSMITSPVHGGTGAWKISGTTEASEHFISFRITPPCAGGSGSKPRLNNAQVRLWFRLDGTGYTGGASIVLYVGHRTTSGTNLVSLSSLPIPAPNAWNQVAWNGVSSAGLDYIAFRVNIPQSGFAASVIVDDVSITNN